MFDNALVEDMAEELWEEGRTIIKDGSGRRLLLTSTSLLQIPGDDIILAYEGRGVIFFQLDRPMNRFRLLSHGFPDKVAGDIADMVNLIISALAKKRQVEAAVPHLEGPEND